jgi:HD-GYP domain-containing protein (c-di-GMP phosphodiesterase class II)
MMVRGRAKHFDPHLLDLFLESLDVVMELRERHKDPERPA